ncbi:MAG: acetyltransferase [Candidatus Eisenbacteria bacterium]
MSDVIVVGGGGHARVMVAIALRDGGRALIGRTDAPARDEDRPLIGYTDLRDRGSLQGLPYLGNDEILDRRAGPCELLLGVGLTQNAHARWRLYRRHADAGRAFAGLVSTRSSVARDVHLGAGAVVFDLAAVNPGAILGEACIVNTGAIVEHDCRLGDNVHISVNATLCGEVTVGDHCLIGAGATVVPGVRIAGGSIIGAGAVVTADIPESGTYLGAPAVRRGEGMRT